MNHTTLPLPVDRGTTRPSQLVLGSVIFLGLRAAILPRLDPDIQQAAALIPLVLYGLAVILACLALLQIWIALLDGEAIHWSVMPLWLVWAAVGLWTVW